MARRLIPAHEQPDAASEVARWLVAEWAHLYPDWDHQAAVEYSFYGLGVLGLLFASR